MLPRYIEYPMTMKGAERSMYKARFLVLNER